MVARSESIARNQGACLLSTSLPRNSGPVLVLGAHTVSLNFALSGPWP